MKKSFHTDVKVIYADTDAMGVVYHTNYIRWFEIGRTELLRDLDFPYTNLEKIPLWMPLTQAHCEYKKPAHYDDVVEVVTHISELGYASMIIEYEILLKATGELLVTGYTRHGFTNDKLKPVSLKKVCPELYEAMLEVTG